MDLKTMPRMKLSNARAAAVMPRISLPRLPPLNPQIEEDGPDLSPIIEMINASLVPIHSAWGDPVRVKFKCAGCGELRPWKSHHWGSWDTGQKQPILVRRRDGKGFARIYVPIRRAGRTCTDCTMGMTDWKMSKEPDVTVLRDAESGKAEGSRAPKRGKRDNNHTTIWRTWYAATTKHRVEVK